MYLDYIEVQESGFLYRYNNDIEFYIDKKENYEQLLQIKKVENNYHLRLNDYSLDDNGNVTTTNSTWFLLRKKFLEERMNDYNIKEGDILRIGRITIRIKKIKFTKDKDNKDKDNISINTNLNLKENLVEKNTKKIHEKIEKSKYRICRICYLEEDTVENPLIQPCACSGSMKYIHLECLKHWLKTSIFIKIESNQDSFLYLYKTPECELCKTKFTDYIRHKGKLYEILDFKNDFNNYLIIESITIDKNQNKYLYIVNLDRPNNEKNISIGRGHDCHLLLSDISVSRWHCFLTVDKNARKIYIHDNNSKFGTLILVQSKSIVMCLQLKLCIQIGRTYLEFLLKETFSLLNCCGVGEKKNADFFFVQNKESAFNGNHLTVKNDNDMEYSSKCKEKSDNEKPYIDNLITGPNLILDDNEENNKINQENCKKQEEKENIDDIEKLIYEDEQMNNIINERNIIEDDIINKNNVINKIENEEEKNNDNGINI